MLGIHADIFVPGFNGPAFSYATVCLVCLKKITEWKLQKCAGCKLVFYCSKEHQKLDWSKHKHLCKAVQSMIKCTGNIGLFDDFVLEGSASWHAFTSTLMIVCESIMKRKLYPWEWCLFKNPFVCKLCRIHKHNNMITCSNCCCVSYCSKEHHSKDEAQHSRECRELKFSLDLSTNCVNSFFINTFVYDVRELPANMKIFIDRFVDMKADDVDESYVSCYLSNMLTMPLSLIYAIEKCQINLGKETLRIHVVGSDLFEAKACWCWEYIFHYFKELRSLNLIFIGPESSDCYDPPTLCQDCQHLRSLNLVVENSLYHDYVKSTTEAPDVIIAFNCGFHEHRTSTDDTWRDSIQVFSDYPGTAVVFTSYTLDESVKDLEVLQELSTNDMQIVVECQDNPFKSLMPFYDWYFENGSIYYNNNYICILMS